MRPWGFLLPEVSVPLRRAGFTALLIAVPALLHANPSPCRMAAGYIPVPGVTLDEDSREVVATQGPFRPAPAMDHDDMEMMDGMAMPEMADTIVQRFEWPVNGWLRGFRLDICGPDGKAFPEEVMHHMVLVDLGRRQLWRPIAERLLGIGEETADASLPASVGAPVHRGEPMAIHIMWHNTTGHPIEAYYRLTLLYTPVNMAPRPTDMLPVVFEVSPAVGVLPAYDIPPGRSEASSMFTVPAAGRVLAVGGHLHNYGVSVGVVDGVTGRLLFRVRSRRNPDGTVYGVRRRLLAIRGRGVRLKADHPYRIVAVYDNPTADTVRGVMAQLATMFAPDRRAAWPAVDTTNAEFRRDLDSMRGADVPVDRVENLVATEDRRTRTP
jgi:hypothetical protein